MINKRPIYSNELIKQVKTFAERKLFDAKCHNDELGYIRDMYYSAYGAVCFAAEQTYSKELIQWWDNEMYDKFIKLMIER